MGMVKGPATFEGLGLKIASMILSVAVGAKKAGGVVVEVGPRAGEDVLDRWVLNGRDGLGVVLLRLRGRVRLEDPLIEEVAEAVGR